MHPFGNLSQISTGPNPKPDGYNLSWKQIGVLGTLEDNPPSFFIE
jgi:hypothetical protein